MLVPLFAKTSGRVAQLGRQQDLQRDIDALEAELDAIKKEAEEKEVNRHFQNPLRKGDRRGGRGAASPKVAPPADDDPDSPTAIMAAMAEVDLTSATEGEGDGNTYAIAI